MGDQWQAVPAVDVLTGLSRSYLFENLTRDQLSPLAAAASVRRLARGGYLFRVGDPAEEIYVVLSGEVRDSVVDANGEEVVHFVHGAGTALGEAGYFAVDHHRIIAVVATRPSAVVLLHRRILAPFLEAHPVVKDRALEGLASATRWQTTMISALATRPLTDRLVLRLLELADSNPDRQGGVLRTPRVSQAVLAAMVGVSREHVNRALATLTARNVLRQEGGRYLLLDEALLRHEVSQHGPMVVRRDRSSGELPEPGVAG